MSTHEHPTAVMIPRHNGHRLRRNASWRILLVFITLLSVDVPVAWGENVWLPAQGPAAVHQNCLELEHPAVAMIVAMQPGYEDLPLMAYLRFHLGVRTVAVYLTNGEGTPGDTLGRYPLWLTGERKLEADQVASALGGHAWFVNVPDVPGIQTAADLASLWDTLGIVKRMTLAIRTYQPDLLILCPDRRGNEHGTLRDSVARGFVRRATVFASSRIDTSTSKGLLPWEVSRVYIQKRSTAMPPAFGLVHPLLKISPASMAHTVALLYHTMRLQIGTWLDSGREYFLIGRNGFARRPTAPDELVRGIPGVPPPLRGIEDAIKAAIRVDNGGRRSAELGPVAGAIEKTEHALAVYGPSFSPLEQRLMVSWKNSLEAVRCSILGVSAAVTPSDSLLTTSQIWDLRVSMKPSIVGGSTEIIFPLSMNGDWPVNETRTYHFPLTKAEKFTILTPPELPFVIPVDMYGLKQPAMTTKFPYLIVHKDPVRARNFLLRGEVSLQIGPRRSFVLRTPLIYDDPTSPVIFEMQNFSRDGFKGSVSLSDSSGNNTQSPVAFARKDQVITDTLFLPGGTISGEGSRLCLLELSGRGGQRSVTARRFAVSADSATKIGVLSTIDSSPLRDALRVLRQPHEDVPLWNTSATLQRCTTLVLDRDVTSDPGCTSDVIREIEQWIRNGGNAIVFPQHGKGSRRLDQWCGVSFEQIDPIPPDAAMMVDSTGAAEFGKIAPEDWKGWVETRAFDRIKTSDTGIGQRVVVRSGTDALILSTKFGKGSLIFVAADILSQFINYNPGAFRLLELFVAMRGA